MSKVYVDDNMRVGLKKEVRDPTSPHRMVVKDGGLQALLHVLAVHIWLDSILLLWRVLLFTDHNHYRI